MLGSSNTDIDSLSDSPEAFLGCSWLSENPKLVENQFSYYLKVRAVRF